MITCNHGPKALCDACRLDLQRNEIETLRENLKREKAARASLESLVTRSTALGGTSRCAKCSKIKVLPYRRDVLGGYVCLTCFEAHLDATLDLRDRLAEQVRIHAEAIRGCADGATILADERRQAEEQAELERARAEKAELERARAEKAEARLTAWEPVVRAAMAANDGMVLSGERGELMARLEAALDALRPEDRP